MTSPTPCMSSSTPYMSSLTYGPSSPPLNPPRTPRTSPRLLTGSGQALDSLKEPNFDPTIVPLLLGSDPVLLGPIQIPSRLISGSIPGIKTRIILLNRIGVYLVSILVVYIGIGPYIYLCVSCVNNQLRDIFKLIRYIIEI